MFTNPSNAISLYISSPVGATGTVTIQNPTNGPILIVTNCGDTAVNGTYFLTNETIDPSVYGLQAKPVHGAYAKGNFVVFFDNDPSADLGWVLADTNTKTPLYYGGSAEIINLNDDSWMDLPPNGSGTPPTTLCEQFTFSQSFTLAAGGLTNVPIPAGTMMIDNDNDVIETNHGVHITSTAPISVYAVDYFPQATAAFTAYPTSLLGTNYCLMARPSFDSLDDGHSEFAIVATEDTLVTITPSATAGTLFFNHFGPYTTNLEMGQTYQTDSFDKADDVTGTVITSDKPIAVFAGANLAFVPDGGTHAANPLVQEQIPVNEWGTNTLALSFAGRNGGDSYRVLAASNSTIVRITGNVLTSTNELTSPYTVTTSNGTVTVTITNAGQFYDIGVEGPAQFKANKPIQVAHFANGVNFDAPAFGYGDPCEMLLPSTDRYMETNIIVSLPDDSATGDFAENYLTIIVPQSAITNTLVDANHIPATNFVAIGNSGYYGTQISTNSGVHKVTSSQPVGVGVYGWGNQDAYGYFGGIVK